MKIFFVSLGCDKNLVDSEQMTGLLLEKGFSLTDNEEEADIVVINSCCFIGDAKEESIEAVIEAGRLKEEGRVKYIVLTGCLAERYSDEILTELPEVDAVIGTAAFDSIVPVIEKLEKKTNGERIVEKKDINVLTNPEVSRSISTGGHYEYLKIAEGCDRNCSYCIIPKIRGHYRSVPLERLIRDAGELVSKGVRELILVAQETTLYGQDLYGKKMLPELLRKLSSIEGLRWIRLLYCYPEEIDKELISAIKELPKVCHYLDIPIQHYSDRILKSMGRRTRGSEIEELINNFRKEIPDIAIRTTLITGFPGETEDEHREVLDFVKRMAFDRLGVFEYSPEEGTKAAAMPDQIADEIKKRRRDELMGLQQEISLSVHKGLTGAELECIIEGRIPEDKVYVARSYRDAPNVDGMVFIDEEGAGPGLLTGDFVRVKVTGASEYDLFGEITE